MEEKTMNQELFGKWYVYRYNLATPVLKAPETSLEITEVNGVCRARFELKGQSQPVEIAMTRIADPSGGGTDAETSDWHGENGSIDFRWAVVEAGVLTGQAFYKSNPGKRRDFFVAVRTRRTNRLPDESVYTFGEAHSTPLQQSERSTGKPDDIFIHLGEKKIRFDGKIYTMKARPQGYNRGLKVTGQYPPVGQPVQSVCLWILPVVDPKQSGCLLATGFYEYHQEYNTGASRPECQRGLQLC